MAAIKQIIKKDSFSLEKNPNKSFPEQAPKKNRGIITPPLQPLATVVLIAKVFQKIKVTKKIGVNFPSTKRVYVVIPKKQITHPRR